MDYPAQVFEVYLCGVKPKDEDADWPEEVNLSCIDTVTYAIVD